MRSRQVALQLEALRFIRVPSFHVLFGTDLVRHIGAKQPVIGTAFARHVVEALNALLSCHFSEVERLALVFVFVFSALISLHRRGQLRVLVFVWIFSHETVHRR